MCDKQHSSRIARGRSATFDQDGASKRVSRLITEPWQPRRTPEIPKATSTRLSPPRSSPPSCKSRSRSGRRRGSPPSRWRRASPSSRCTGPSNVDHPGKLELLLAALVGIARRIPPVFPLHPRTQAMIESAGLDWLLCDSSIIVAPPLSYLRTIGLMREATFVITDSGGRAKGDDRLGGALSDGQGE
jgi:UDP-N-acetylglucosamine 2-epimerase